MILETCQHCRMQSASRIGLSLKVRCRTCFRFRIRTASLNKRQIDESLRERCGRLLWTGPNFSSCGERWAIRKLIRCLLAAKLDMAARSFLS